MLISTPLAGIRLLPKASACQNAVKHVPKAASTIKYPHICSSRHSATLPGNMGSPHDSDVSLSAGMRSALFHLIILDGTHACTHACMHASACARTRARAHTRLATMSRDVDIHVDIHAYANMACPNMRHTLYHISIDLRYAPYSLARANVRTDAHTNTRACERAHAHTAAPDKLEKYYTLGQNSYFSESAYARMHTRTPFHAPT